MTLKEIKRQIEAAQAEYEANKAKADGSYNADAAGKLWDSLPRVFYKDLPEKIKRPFFSPSPSARRRRFLGKRLHFAEKYAMMQKA